MVNSTVPFQLLASVLRHQERDFRKILHDLTVVTNKMYTICTLQMEYFTPGEAKALL